MNDFIGTDIWEMILTVIGDVTPKFNRHIIFLSSIGTYLLLRAMEGEFQRGIE